MRDAERLIVLECDADDAGADAPKQRGDGRHRKLADDRSSPRQMLSPRGIRTGVKMRDTLSGQRLGIGARRLGSVLPAGGPAAGGHWLLKSWQ